MEIADKLYGQVDKSIINLEKEMKKYENNKENKENFS